jgi:heat shock protein 1/8
MKKSGIELRSIISDACAACLSYELDKESGHVERYTCYSSIKTSLTIFFSNVLVYRLGGSTYECSILRMVGGCIRTLVSSYGFEHCGDAFTDIVMNIIVDEFQKYVDFSFLSSSDFFFLRRKNKSDPRSASRSLLKLRASSEQAKHALATTPATQCSIDTLHDGIDLDCTISRCQI